MKVYVHKLSYAKNHFSIKEIKTDKVGVISLDNALRNIICFKCERYDYYYLFHELQPLFSPLCNNYLYHFSLKPCTEKEIARFILSEKRVNNKEKVKMLNEAIERK